MLRAIFFDFYGVWAPDKFSDLISQAEQSNPPLGKELHDSLKKYYLGIIDHEQLIDSFRYKLELPGLDSARFKLNEADLSQNAIRFIQYLHTHFLKVGILANLGKYEHELLVTIDKKYQLFETIIDSYDQGSNLLTKEVFVKAFRAIGEPKDSCLIVAGHANLKNFAENLGIAAINYSGFSNLTATIENIIQNQKNK